MGRRSNEEINNFIKVSIENEFYELLTEEEFNKINNLYKFMKIRNNFYDRKRNKVVCSLIKGYLSNENSYKFSLNWLKKELFCTNSKTLLDVVKNNPKLLKIKAEYDHKLLMDRNKLLNSLQKYVNLGENVHEEGLEEVNQE